MNFTSKGILGVLFFFAMSTNVLSAQTGENPVQQEIQTEVSDAELEKFAQAYQRIRMLTQQAQQQMTKVVQEGGLEVKRFNEIYEASLNPEVEVETTAEEETKFEDISTEIEELQLTIQAQMEDLIVDQDLTVERYQQIATQLQTDPELQERLRALFEN